jgi:hypothetical protein
VRRRNYLRQAIRSACDAEHDSALTGRLTGQISQLNLQPMPELAPSQSSLYALSDLPIATWNMDFQTKLVNQQPLGHDTSFSERGRVVSRVGIIGPPR